MSGVEERVKIFVEVEQERAYQERRWSTEADDTKNTPWMWAAYIAGYATRWMTGLFLPLPRQRTDEFRRCMVKVACLAVAAIESVDRQREQAGQTFYEE